VVEQCTAEEVIDEFKKGKAYFLSDEEIKRLEAVVFDRKQGIMNLAIVGKPASVIARMSNIDVPADTCLLLAPLKGVGDEYSLSSEILAPILAFYVAESFEEAVNLCIDLNFHGGIGHTVSLFSNSDQKIKQFASVMNAGRIVVNTPSSQGAVGGIYNTLHPSFTLGCGTGGKNITTDNVTATHLLNIQRIARRRMNERIERFDMSLYLDESLDARAIEQKFNRNY